VRLTQSVTDRLIAMLRSGRLRPGAKLPSERELRAKMQVGRSSIREALQALIAMGMIEAYAGRGYFVRADSGRGAARPQLKAHPLAESHSLLELIEARMIVEPEIAALAAKQATPLDFAALNRALLRIVEAARQGRTVYRAAAMFHVEFAKAAHNAALVQMVRSLVSVMSYWGRVFEWAPGRAQEEVRLHRDLLECLRLQEPEKMRRKMQEHILLTRQALVAYLAGRQRPARRRGSARRPT
jgi:GntR family transcriptional repressor for pyruvate dehydrogenase complex